MRIIGGIVMFIGIGLLVWAGITPLLYSMSSANALQATGVYSEATYRALLGIGALLVTLIIAVYDNVIYQKDESEDEDEVEPVAPRSNPDRAAVEAQLNAARVMIHAQQYVEARKLLLSIRSPKAEPLLAEINTLMQSEIKTQGS